MSQDEHRVRIARMCGSRVVGVLAFTFAMLGCSEIDLAEHNGSSVLRGLCLAYASPDIANVLAKRNTLSDSCAALADPSAPLHIIDYSQGMMTEEGRTGFIGSYPSYGEFCREALGVGNEAAQFCPDFSDARRAEIDAVTKTFAPSAQWMLAIFLAEAKACTVVGEKLLGHIPQKAACAFGTDHFLFPAFESSFDASDKPEESMRRRFPLGSNAAALRDALGRSRFKCSSSGDEWRCEGSTSFVMLTEGRLVGWHPVLWDLVWLVDKSGRLERFDVKTTPFNL